MDVRRDGERCCHGVARSLIHRKRKIVKEGGEVELHGRSECRLFGSVRMGIKD